MELNNKKIINAWCIYDWANSAYSLVITSTIFPIYYNVMTRQQFGGETVTFFGYPIVNTVLFSYAISAAYFIIALISPLLSGLADYGGKKRFFMQLFVLIGGLACINLYGFNGKNIELGIISFALATIGYSGSIVFYNAFLPEIATPEKFDDISARGFSFGYIGSVLLLIVNLYLIQNYEKFGIDQNTATRLAFLMVGIWWIGFSLITFHYIKDETRHKMKLNAQTLGRGFKEISIVAKEVNHQTNIKRFLFSFFFYSMGVQTIMFLAAIFAEKELKMEGADLIILVLILQMVAILGAYLASKLSDKVGNKITLLVLISIWIMVCGVAYFIQDSFQFYLTAAVIGLIMGGIQSMSRSTYSKLIPEQTPNTASYFSFYDILEKIGIMIGTLCYGYIEMVTGSMRNSILALGLFFLIGILAMARTHIQHEKEKID